MSSSPQAARLADLIRASDSTVALTGAGISVPSGIPDFRSPRTGLWENVDPMEVAHIDVFRRDPGRFWRFYGQRFQVLEDKRPNRAHRALARLEREGLLAAVVTQNIDGLHAAAGSQNVIEVHGSIASASCPACGASYPLAEVRARQAADPRGVPKCDCDRVLKPDVILFGEYLPVAAFARAERLAGEAELLLCVGSSLEVFPVAQLPAITLGAGGQIAVLTQGSTPYDSRAEVRMRGDVVEELEAVLAALGLEQTTSTGSGTGSAPVPGGSAEAEGARR